ncbi:MAG: hypothetical protein ACJA01_004532, partial [Saprospiraceae bacterium]
MLDCISFQYPLILADLNLIMLVSPFFDNRRPDCFILFCRTVRCADSIAPDPIIRFLDM